ncbi:hypothetical protein TNCV_356911 [Trichonephila clavipes]|nr:hypothetical protein TNCV_356911 [Trichonephila clavipes]
MLKKRRVSPSQPDRDICSCTSAPNGHVYWDGHNHDLIKDESERNEAQTESDVRGLGQLAHTLRRPCPLQTQERNWAR